MFELVRENKALMQAYQNVTEGKPDCWDHVGWYDLKKDAVKALKMARDGRHMIRDENGIPIMFSGDVM